MLCDLGGWGVRTRGGDPKEEGLCKHMADSLRCVAEISTTF